MPNARKRNGGARTSDEPHFGAPHQGATVDRVRTRSRARKASRKGGLYRVRFRLPDGTEITFTHSGLHDDETRRTHEAGWTGSLDKLEARFAGGEAA